MGKKIEKTRNLNSWLYQGEELEEIPLNSSHFVYKITEKSTGKFYIGYKGFYSNRKKKLLKSEISTDKRKKLYKREIKESDWKSYNSSNKELSELVLKNPSNFTKIILLICYTEKQAKYYEQKFQFTYEVLEKDSFNGNIAGKFFRKDLENGFQ